MGLPSIWPDAPEDRVELLVSTVKSNSEFDVEYVVTEAHVTTAEARCGLSELESEGRVERVGDDGWKVIDGDDE